MPSVSDWSIKLAAAAAPDEVDLAPAIADAYLSGGASRAELFKQSGASVAGAFGPGTAIAVLPWILRGLAQAATWLSSLLASTELGNITSFVKNAVDLGKALQPQEPAEDTPETAPYRSLKQVLDVFGAELRSAGIPPDQADLITFRTLNALLEEPQSAAAFIKELEAS